MSVLLGIDPGLRTGFSFVDEIDGDVRVLSEGSVHFNDIVDWIAEELPSDAMPERIVCESFQLFGSKAKQQIGSEFETVQVIGMMKFIAKLHGVSIEMQPPSIKPIAVKFSGRRPVGTHDKSHHVDAYNHVIYWLREHDRFNIAG